MWRCVGHFRVPSKWLVLSALRALLSHEAGSGICCRGLCLVPQLSEWATTVCAMS